MFVVQSIEPFIDIQCRVTLVNAPTLLLRVKQMLSRRIYLFECFT